MTDEIRKGPSGTPVGVASGDATLPLARALFVDPGTSVPTAEQTGFIGLPFATAQQAVDALEPEGVVLLSLGDAGTVDAEQAVSFRGLGVPGVSDTAMAQLGALSSTAAVSCESLVVASVSSAGNVTLRSCVLGPITDSLNTVLQDCSGGDVAADGNLRLESCEFAASLFSVGLALEAFDSLLIVDVIAMPTGALTARGSSFQGAVITASTCDLTDCFLGSGSLTATAFAQLEGCTVAAGGLTTNSAALRNCVVVGTVALALAGTIVGCELRGGNVSCGGNLELLQTEVDGNLSVTGNLSIDEYSRNTILNAGHTITVGGTTTVVDAHDTGTLLAVTVYASGSGNHVYNPRTSFALVEMISGGSGGGGVTGGLAAAGAAGGGASGKRTLLKFARPLSLPQSAYSVGAAGAAGAAGADGGNGGSTTFVVPGPVTRTLSASFGGSGIASGVVVSVASGGPDSAADVFAESISSVGSSPGGAGITLSAAVALSGAGAVGPLGGGAAGRASVGNGRTGTGPGAGGSGALSINNATNRTGGVGVAGQITVWEYVGPVL